MSIARPPVDEIVPELVKVGPTPDEPVQVTVGVDVLVVSVAPDETEPASVPVKLRTVVLVPLAMVNGVASASGATPANKPAMSNASGRAHRRAGVQATENFI
jgi:hypothetical protein